MKIEDKNTESAENEAPLSDLQEPPDLDAEPTQDFATDYEPSDENESFNIENSFPHNIDAEKSVLCSMLISPVAVESALETLRASDFYFPAHAKIFTAMEKLYNRSYPIDSVTVLDSLESMGEAENVGNIMFLTELSTYLPSAANVAYHIGIVKEHGTRRRLMRIGEKLLSDAENSKIETRDTIEKAEREIFEVAMNKEESSLVHIDVPLIAGHKKIGELISLGGALSGITTGFADLDKLTSGLQKSDLIIVAARPSMGKTAFALNIATNAALRGKASVAIFSLEMPAEQLVMRIICSEACVDMQKVKSGNPNSDDLMKIAEVMQPLEQSRIFIDDTGGTTVADIRSKCRRLKAKSGLDLVVIDYLQLMKTTSHEESRVLAVSDMTRSLKILARELDIPIIVLSQLSRATERRSENPRPIMSDLRESGAIEQDADVIIMLYRPAVYGKSDDNVSEIIVTKHRNGPTDTVKLAWIPEYTKFTNATFDYD